MTWLIYIVLAGAAGAHIVVVNIADMPAPERLAAKLWTVMLSSAVLGGALGRMIFGSMLEESNPMPGRAIVGAAGVIAAGLVLGAATAILTGLHVKPAGRGL